MRRPWIIASLVALGTLALYWPAKHFDLVYWDDPLLLQDSPEIQAGLTWASFKWAWTSVVIANWQPLTNLSFLAVAQFFGTAPGPHHLANAIIHAVNAALLFLFLIALRCPLGKPFAQPTAASASDLRPPISDLRLQLWCAALIAALFAWHPLRVESVVWIAERKDVLCAFFWLLSLLAYARYAQHVTWPLSSSFVIRHSSLSYWLSLLFFALALLSKPMAVTLPFVLLLLDVWPLGRFAIYDLRFTIYRTLFVEKIPFFLLMVVFCLGTYWIQHDYAAMTPWEKLGLGPRVCNSIASYVAYLGQLFWPMGLAEIYPYPKSFDPTMTVLKAALLLAITVACLLQRSRRPWLAVGWFWYLITALPVIGIVQVGEQAMADRYTYIPLIGPVIALVWTVADMVSGRRRARIFLTAAAVLVVSTLAVLTSRQLQYWQNTITLFAHNVEVTPDNGSAHFTLGLGYLHAGDTNRAITCFRVARQLSPRDLQVRQTLGDALRDQGRISEAAAEYAAMIQIEPTDSAAHAALAGVLAMQGQQAESIAELNEAVRLNPDFAEALNNLAWTLATTPQMDLRDPHRAVILAQHACEITKFQKTQFIGTLAAAQAAAGNFDDAIATAQRACASAAKNGETNLLQINQTLLQRYRVHQPAQ